MAFGVVTSAFAAGQAPVRFYGAAAVRDHVGSHRFASCETRIATIAAADSGAPHDRPVAATLLHTTECTHMHQNTTKGAQEALCSIVWQVRAPYQSHMPVHARSQTARLMAAE